jgi:hypothetical protein
VPVPQSLSTRAAATEALLTRKLGAAEEQLRSTVQQLEAAQVRVAGEAVQKH